ncbi:MAG: ATP-binding cassette domain-containing protein [Alphaproteobacteria bacterium]|nr:ATP-binding cassette domain-containing protein [Alphaproteobacteria bacterium]
MSDIKIQIRNLYKSFGSNKVLQGIDLDVHDGQSIAIIGASGTGKSVLLKCILGLIKPDSGSATVDGIETVGASRQTREDVLRKFGMLFQGGALFDSLPVWENIMFRFRQNNALSIDELRQVATDTLADVLLEERVLDLYPAELSGGMQKRVGLARAIADKPGILFFDEPTSGLDPITSGVINRLIRNAVDRLGATAMTISHDMNSVRQIADQVAMIHDRHIIWQGSVKDMETVDHPVVHQFVHGLPTGPLTKYAESI